LFLTHRRNIHTLGVMAKVQLVGAAQGATSSILSEPALAFVTHLHERFARKIRDALSARGVVTAKAAAALASQPSPAFDFLPSTEAIRNGTWKVAEPPPDVLDRRVEITGPVDRKMVINALNSGANVYMADFEDSTCPTWSNLIDGQQNLCDAVAGTIRHSQGSKEYALRNDAKLATLFVRPRGLHLPEKHVLIDDVAVAGSLFDFGLYFFHNVHALLARGARPYFYLPKLESHLEARIWNEVFIEASSALNVPVGTVRATVLIETLPAAFQMDEILFELREHSLGLNCGRWDYIFSFIKQQKENPKALLPDRSQVTMDKGFLRAYSELLVATCHRRGAHAMGGMTAVIPVKDNATKNAEAMARVRADKLREVRAGHDGTWVAHPALVQIARAVFDEELGTPNQIDMQRACSVTADELLSIPDGTRTLAGLQANIRIGIEYIEAWLRGVGCVPIDNLMEDAATAEISRSQVWQWVRHGASIEGVGPLTEDRSREMIRSETQALIARNPTLTGAPARRFSDAEALFLKGASGPQFEDFLTLSAYDTLINEGL
jgi:malate synthase